MCCLKERTFLPYLLYGCILSLLTPSLSPIQISLDRFLKQFTKRVDLNTRAYFDWICMLHWLGFRLDVNVLIILTGSCFFSTAISESNSLIGEKPSLHSAHVNYLYDIALKKCLVLHFYVLFVWSGHYFSTLRNEGILPLF